MIEPELILEAPEDFFIVTDIEDLEIEQRQEEEYNRHRQARRRVRDSL